MTEGEPVSWAPELSLLADVGPGDWVVQALERAARSGTVAALVPAVFEAYARVLPPTYVEGEHEPRVRWPAIAASTGVALSAATRFDDLVAGRDEWGLPSDGGLDARETTALARVLGRRTSTPERAYFCLWDGFGIEEVSGWWGRSMRVRAPDRAYHLLTGPVSAAVALPTPVEWRCASLWWPADRAWLVATDIDGYLTYIGGSRAAVAAVIADPALDALPAGTDTPLDPSWG